MPKTIQPLDNKVLVKRSEPPKKTAGGILLPEISKEKPKTGKVEAVGMGKLLDSGERGKPQVKKGDEVVFTAYAGHEIEINGEEFVLMEETDIMGILK